MLKNSTDEITSEMVVIIPEDLIGAGPPSEIESPASEDSFFALVGEDFGAALALVRGQIVNLVGDKEETKQIVLRLENEVERLEKAVTDLQNENGELKEKVRSLDLKLQKQTEDHHAHIKNVVAGVQYMIMADVEKMVEKERMAREKAQVMFDEELAKERQLRQMDREALIAAIMHEVRVSLFYVLILSCLPKYYIKDTQLLNQIRFRDILDQIQTALAKATKVVHTRNPALDWRRALDNYGKGLEERLRGANKLLKSASKPEVFSKLVNSKEAWTLVCEKESEIRNSGDEVAHPLISSLPELTRVRTAAMKELDGETQKGVLDMVDFLFGDK